MKKKRMSYPCDHKSEEETDKVRFNRNIKAVQGVTVRRFKASQNQVKSA